MSTLKDIVPVEGKEYYFKLLYPRSVDPFEIGELVFESMSHAPVHQLALGTFRPPSQSAIRQSIVDPRKRLDAYIQAMKLKKETVQAYGTYLHAALMFPRSLAWGLYHKGNLYDEMVGYAQWRMPLYFKDEVDARLGKSGLSYNIWVWFKLIQLKFRQFWTFLRYGQYLTLHNERLLRLKAHRKTLYDENSRPFMPTRPEHRDKLAQMSFEELKDQVYHSDDVFYLGIFCVHPDYKRQGLGKALMQHCLNEIPVVKIPIASSDGKFSIEGPQQLTLLATDEGRPFYLSQGWKLTYDHQYTADDGLVVNNDRMDLVRF